MMVKLVLHINAMKTGIIKRDKWKTLITVGGNTRGENTIELSNWLSLLTHQNSIEKHKKMHTYQ